MSNVVRRSILSFLVMMTISIVLVACGNKNNDDNPAFDKDSYSKAQNEVDKSKGFDSDCSQLPNNTNSDKGCAELNASLIGTHYNNTTATKLMGTDFTKLPNGGNLNNLNKTNQNLSGAIFHGLSVSDSILIGADLTGSDLSNATLNNVSLVGANLSNANLTGVTVGLNTSFVDAHFAGANLANANLSRVTMQNAHITDANLSNVKLDNVSLIGADLSRTNMRGITVSGRNTSFVMAHFTGTNLADANFTGIMMRNATFTGAFLTNASFTSVNFNNASFQDAHLDGATFMRATFTNASFINASATDIKIGGSTRLVNVDLSGADLSGIVFLDDTTSIFNITVSSTTHFTCPTHIIHTSQTDYDAIFSKLVSNGCPNTMFTIAPMPTH